jgi:multisubunit Na+/H+ antiporter MnhG subunit
MSKTVEVGVTLGVVAVFVALLGIAGATGFERAGTVLAILAFILLSSGAGYVIARETHS